MKSVVRLSVPARCALLLAACSRQPTQAAGQQADRARRRRHGPGLSRTPLGRTAQPQPPSPAGRFQRLATTIPPQSPVAWSSVITGMDPGGHGIFDFVHRNPATRMPASSMAETHRARAHPRYRPLRDPAVRRRRAQPARRPRLLADCSPNTASRHASSACPPTSRPRIAKPSRWPAWARRICTAPSARSRSSPTIRPRPAQEVPGGQIVPRRCHQWPRARSASKVRQQPPQRSRHHQRWISRSTSIPICPRSPLRSRRAAVHPAAGRVVGVGSGRFQPRSRA